MGMQYLRSFGFVRDDRQCNFKQNILNPLLERRAQHMLFYDPSYHASLLSNRHIDKCFRVLKALTSGIFPVS